MTRALAAADQRLAPCDVRTFAVQMDRLLTFAATFAIKVPDPKALTEIYRKALNLPPDLMVDAVGQVIANWRWGNRLPLPGDLAALVADDMREREADRRKLRLAHRKATAAGGAPAPGKREPGPDQINTADLPSAAQDAYWLARLDGRTPAEALRAARGEDVAAVR